MAGVAMVLGVLVWPGCGASELPVPREPKGGCSRDILSALDRGDERAVKDLVRRGAVGDCPKTRAGLDSAVLDDRRELLKLLLTAGADPDFGVDTAIRRNRPEFLELLLSAGADPNHGGLGEFPNPGYPLRVAIQGRILSGRSLDVIRVLLAHGADPNHRENYFWNPRTEFADDSGLPYIRCGIELRQATPLIAAAVAGDVALIRMLLASGADVIAHDADGKTAIDYARARSDLETIAILQHGRGTSSINSSNQPMRAPLKPC